MLTEPYRGNQTKMKDKMPQKQHQYYTSTMEDDPLIAMHMWSLSLSRLSLSISISLCLCVCVYLHACVCVWSLCEVFCILKVQRKKDRPTALTFYCLNQGGWEWIIGSIHNLELERSLSTAIRDQLELRSKDKVGVGPIMSVTGKKYGSFVDNDCWWKTK